MDKKQFIDKVTILILVDGFLQYGGDNIDILQVMCVTILILVDGFLQFNLCRPHIYPLSKSQSLF